MKKLISLIICLLLLLTCLLVFPMTSTAANTTYYVDSVNGNNSNNGTSEATAWKNFIKVNQMTFGPGDKVLFKRGGVWTGQLSPSGSGAAGNPIIFDAYGEGPLPLINGNGLTSGWATGSTIYFANQSYITVRNFEVTNAKNMDMSDTSVWDKRMGIYFNSTGAGNTVRGITIENNYVHTITATSWGGGLGGGGESHVAAICVWSSSWNAGFADCIVRNNTVMNVGYNGIHLSGGKGQGTNKGEGFLVENNYLKRTGGEGVTVRTCTDAMVQNNVVDGSHAFSDYYHSAFFPFETDNSTFQYNEAMNTVKVGDGHGYDADYISRNTLIQYNYSHNNAGGFLLVCNEPPASNYNINTIVRYNISHLDRHIIFVLHTHIDGTHIYNNTIHISGSTGFMYLGYNFGNPSTGLPKNTTFYNNIVYSTSSNAGISGNTVQGVTSTWNTGASNSAQVDFKNNTFYGQYPSGMITKIQSGSTPSSLNDTSLSTADPMFVNMPTSQVTGVFNLNGWMLKEGSPAIGTGRVMANNGGRDFFGYTVSATAAPNRGAYGGPGIKTGENAPPTNYTKLAQPTAYVNPPTTTRDPNETTVPTTTDETVPTTTIDGTETTDISDTTTDINPITETTTGDGVLKGDINGDRKINGLDLLLMKQHILSVPGKELEEGTPAFFAADMNDDGKINGMDLLLLKKKILG